MADSARKQISAAISGIISPVSGVANVHEFHRYTRSPEGYKEMFTELVSQHQRRLNTWIISLANFSQTTQGVPHPQAMRTYTFTIEGFRGLKDATGSEEEFLDAVEGVFDALEPRVQLGIPGVVEFASPLSVPMINHEWLGPVLSNHCQIQIQVLVRRHITYVP